MLYSLEESGDTVFVKDTEDILFFAAIDALGHGDQAYFAASIAKEYLESNITTDICHHILEMHERLKKSRGVVIALAYIVKSENRLYYTGIGNISFRIFGENNTRLVPRDGILGFNIPTPKISEHNLFYDDMILAYSDGIKEHFEALEIPAGSSAEEAANFVMDNYSKQNDDASVLIIKVAR